MSTRAAVLILEHQNPRRLAALARSLRHDDIDLYIHIDARVEVEPFVRELPAGHQVVYVTDRVPVHWGGPGVVWACHAALGRAMDSGRDYGRYAFLSGADMRIAPLEQILQAWATNIEFVGVERLLTPSGRRPDWRVARRHFLDAPGFIGRRLSGRLPRPVDTTIELHHGSAWWALTADAARHVRVFIDQHPEWMRFHRHTFASDEIIVPSIIANSTYAAHVAQNRSGNVHGMHYIDWPGATSTHPKVLGVEDIDALRGSSALFARKVGEDSGELMAALQTDTYR